MDLKCVWSCELQSVWTSLTLRWWKFESCHAVKTCSLQWCCGAGRSHSGSQAGGPSLPGSGAHVVGCWSSVDPVLVRWRMCTSWDVTRQTWGELTTRKERNELRKHENKQSRGSKNLQIPEIQCFHFPRTSLFILTLLYFLLYIKVPTHRKGRKRLHVIKNVSITVSSNKRRRVKRLLSPWRSETDGVDVVGGGWT